MGTVTITGSGFANLPALAPPDWPAGITWPGGQSPNGTKAYTVSDADWISLLSWAAANYQSALAPAPTAGQILLAWVQGWINATRDSVQRFKTTAPVIPPPITIT